MQDQPPPLFYTSTSLLPWSSLTLLLRRHLIVFCAPSSSTCSSSGFFKSGLASRSRCKNLCTDRWCTRSRLSRSQRGRRTGCDWRMAVMKSRRPQDERGAEKQTVDRNMLVSLSVNQTCYLHEMSSFTPRNWKTRCVDGTEFRTAIVSSTRTAPKSTASHCRANR